MAEGREALQGRHGIEVPVALEHGQAVRDDAALPRRPTPISVARLEVPDGVEDEPSRTAVVALASRLSASTSAGDLPQAQLCTDAAPALFLPQPRVALGGLELLLGGALGEAALGALAAQGGEKERRQRNGDGPNG